jgi:hypothetical protein
MTDTIVYVFSMINNLSLDCSNSNQFPAFMFILYKSCPKNNEAFDTPTTSCIGVPPSGQIGS